MREWYLSDLARHIGVSPSSLQRELAGPVAVETRRRRVDGNRVYYRAEADNPIFGDLRGLLLRTAGLKDVLVECLAGFRSRIDAAFVYGSVARGDESAASDVDLMVIGNVGLSELVPALKNAEARPLRWSVRRSTGRKRLPRSSARGITSSGRSWAERSSSSRGRG